VARADPPPLLATIHLRRDIKCDLQLYNEMDILEGLTPVCGEAYGLGVVGILFPSSQS
jgi:hypothetical protein